MAVYKAQRELPAEFDDAKPDLLPQVRHRMSVELSRLETRLNGGDLNWPHVVIADQLALTLVYDGREQMMGILGKLLDDWGRTFYEALEAARQNLLERSMHEFESLAPGVWRSPWRDNYDVARLVLPELIRHHPVRGAPVAIVPDQDSLILTGDEDIEGMRLVFRMADDAKDACRPVSVTPIRLASDDTWEPLRLPSDHPLSLPLKRLQTFQTARNYADQQEPLQQLEGENAFIASCSVMENKETGDWTTISADSKDECDLLRRNGVPPCSADLRTW